MADDSASEDQIIVISAIVTKLKEDRSKKRRKRSTWVKPWLEKRPATGVYTAFLDELQSADAPGYRINSAIFGHR